MFDALKQSVRYFETNCFKALKQDVQPIETNCSKLLKQVETARKLKDSIGEW